jgi:ABC-2 type transport system ATP-binding protein
MPAIRAEGVSKSFGPNAAIREISLEAGQGTLGGLIGPDGAGKSTLLRLLIGLLRPTEGLVEIAGFDAAKKPFQVKERVGYMPQHFSLYGDLSVAENMKFFADLYSVKEERFAARKAELLKFSALGPFEDRLARNLSGGMQKKLALACNLFHTPEILLLDEPTTGVDPVSRQELWLLLTELHEQGVTILMTTPYMDEAARCGKVGFINEGRILAYDSPENLTAGMKDEIGELVAALEPSLKALKGLPGLKSVHPFGETIHIVLEAGGLGFEKIREKLETEKIAVKGLRKIPPSFEDVFLALALKRNYPPSPPYRKKGGGNRMNLEKEE